MPSDPERGEGADDAEEAPAPGEGLLAPGGDGGSEELPERLSRHFDLHARLLHAMHASHERLVKALERGDRADVVVKSTDALNRTFRQLHESQATLAQQLLRERRRGPWRTAAAVLLAGGLLVAGGVVVHRQTVRPLGEEIERLASAREERERSAAALAIELRDNGARILEAVDQGLAANRVLANENRAREVELARLRERMAELEEQAAAAATERDAARDATDDGAAELAALKRELAETRSALEEARTELIDRDLARTELSELLEASSAADAEPAPPTPEEVATRTAAERRLEEVNTFLADAGLVGIRLLRAEGIVDGHLDRALFEIRNDQGYPIGFHDAARARFRVDPETARGAIVLLGGSTVVRGVRSPFPAGELVLDIPAVLPGSASVGTMAEVTEVRAADVLPRDVAADPAPPTSAADPLAPAARAPTPLPSSVAAAVPPPSADVVAVPSDEPGIPSPPPEPASSPPFEPGPLLAALNERLRAEGGGRLEFDRVRGIGPDGLEEVIAHNYGPSGQLSKTVVARRCSVEFDARDREVVFRFLDGHHVTRGREVPFFRGRGADAGSWTYRVRGADTERWRERLAAGGWRPGE
ncbi:MAG: hypothetical protein ACF8XB_09160 [Planctomycetota bacterium JB042]